MEKALNCLIIIIIIIIIIILMIYCKAKTCGAIVESM